MRLRLLHVTPYSGSTWAYGGIPRVVEAETAALAARGHDVCVCTTDARDAATRLTRPAGPPSGHRPIEHVFPNVSNRLAYHLQGFAPIGLGGFVRRHASRFDVAHLHACRNLPGVFAARHLRAAAVPYVLQPNGTALRLERRLMAKHVFDLCWGRDLLAHAAAVIAVSRAEVDQLRSLGVPACRIRLVPNPVDPEACAWLERGNDTRAADGERRTSRPPLVLYLGKLTPRKRVDVLLSAMPRLARRDARLMVVGNDMGSRRGLEALAGRLALGPRVEFRDLVAGRERLALMASADLVVYPSEDEIFGLVAMESLLTGTPVVVAGGSGCAEIVSSTGGGPVVPPGDPDALARAIDRTLDAGPAARAAARDAGRVVRRRFHPDAIAAALEDVYTAVAPTRSAARRTRPVHQGASDGPGISVLVPVRNGARWLHRTLHAIHDQTRERTSVEIIAVEDGSEDGSRELLDALARDIPLRIVDGRRRGAAAALNTGIRAARYPIICQIDQDVVLEPGWIDAVVRGFDYPRVGAVQGYYASTRTAGLAARITALDLELRYAAIRGDETSHACTGNSAYRAEALHAIGLFDERLGYGYDNDLSYRLTEAGYRLRFHREARSIHAWRDGLRGYCRQQYGLGYGRLEVIAKHPGRAAGDAVSPLPMMLHPVVMTAALAAGALAIALAAGGGPWMPWAAVSAACLGALAAERTACGVRAWRRFDDPAALLFPAYHLLRDLVWVAAVVRWTGRRIARRRGRPIHSMRPRPARLVGPPPPLPAAPRVVVLIPAHDERETLAGVVSDVRTHVPRADVIVLDDGSTDGTGDVADALGVRRIGWAARLGVGHAVRAGIRYARRAGYDVAVRLDADGQHAAENVVGLLAPLLAREADVVVGSRYLEPGRGPAPRPAVRWVQRLLGWCLSHLTARRVTDPTSGFYAAGPRAIRLLAEHHPTGYPEPELRLLLRRLGLECVEVPVQDRRRRGGHTTLTPPRLAGAAVRVMIALAIAPWRRDIRSAKGD